MKYKTILLCLAGLISLTSIGFNIFQYMENNKLSDNLASMKSAQEESAGDRLDALVKAVEDKTQLTGKNPDMKNIRELEYQLDATEEELDMAHNQLAEELNRQEEEKRAERESQKNVLKMRLDKDYQPLFKRLDLSPDKLEDFKDIITDWELANQERYELIDRARTDEEKEEVYRLRQENRDKYNRELIALMGETKFKIYDDYKSRRSERSELKAFMSTMPADESIDESRMADIVDEMYKARKSVENKSGTGGLIAFPAERDKKSMIRRVENLIEVYNRYEEVIGDTLPPAQAELYRAYVSERVKRFEKDLNFIKNELVKAGS